MPTPALATEVEPGPQADSPARDTASRERGRPRGSTTRLLLDGAGQLGRHHFAFLRALLDGIELERAWPLYLSFTGGPSDRRLLVSRLRAVVQAIEREGMTRGCTAELAVALPALRALPDFTAVRAQRQTAKLERPDASPPPNG